MLCQHSRIRLLVIIPILLEVHFHLFFTTIVGFSEGSMLVGQFFLIASSLYAMFAALRDDRRVLMVSMIFASFAVLIRSTLLFD